MSSIILDGSMVHYEALGCGRPIVFLHGWVGSWRYWINAMHQVNLEGAGHFPMIDNPTQFNRLITDFLVLDSGASPRELQMKE